MKTQMGIVLNQKKGQESHGNMKAKEELDAIKIQTEFIDEISI